MAALKATKVRFNGASRGKIRAKGRNNDAQNAGYAKAVAAGYFDEGGKRSSVKRNYGTIPN